MYKELTADFLIAARKLRNNCFIYYIVMSQQPTTLPEHREVEVTEVHLQFIRNQDGQWVVTEITDLFGTL